MQIAQTSGNVGAAWVIFGSDPKQEGGFCTSSIRVRWWRRSFKGLTLFDVKRALLSAFNTTKAMEWTLKNLYFQFFEALLRSVISFLNSGSGNPWSLLLIRTNCFHYPSNNPGTRNVNPTEYWHCHLTKNVFWKKPISTFSGKYEKDRYLGIFKTELFEGLFATSVFSACEKTVFFIF